MPYFNAATSAGDVEKMQFKVLVEKNITQKLLFSILCSTNLAFFSHVVVLAVVSESCTMRSG